MLQRTPLPLLDGLDDIEDEPGPLRFGQLSDRAKERAPEHYREHGMDHQWWDAVYEDAKTVATLLGIDIGLKTYKTVGGTHLTEPAIYFSGFWSQGDGACFEGCWYPPQHDMVEKVKEHAPEDECLHLIAETFAGLARRGAKHGLHATVEHRGCYSHAWSTTIDVRLEKPEGYHREWCDVRAAAYDAVLKHDLGDDYEKDVADGLRSFMNWIYGQLESEYEHQTSDEVVDEALSDTLFDEDGNLA